MLLILTACQGGATINIHKYQTAIGEVAVAEEAGHITNVFLGLCDIPREAVVFETPTIKEAARQLYAYLAGDLKQFSLPLAPKGTIFQLRVWDRLRDIPYGRIVSYKDVAVAVDNARAVRAVGSANNRNPIPIIIPCHRVVGSDGRLVGYGAGLGLKQWLLELEGISVVRGTVLGGVGSAPGERTSI